MNFLRATTSPFNTMTTNLRSFPFLILIAGLSLLNSACQKDEEETPTPVPPSTSVTLKLEHHMDGIPLILDTILYATAAGHAYSVSRLNYYVSGIILIGAGSTPNDTLHGPYYVNGSGSASFNLGDLPAAEYSGAALLLGLPPDLNVTGGLPNTMENVNMAWPDPMGGGYHFIKFEGHFLDGATPTGFAMHVGNNAYLPHAELGQSFTLDGRSGTIALRFNLNELFRTPHTYDLSTGNYSMGDMMLMGQLRDNAFDAFTIEYRP